MSIVSVNKSQTSAWNFVIYLPIQYTNLVFYCQNKGDIQFATLRTKEVGKCGHMIKIIPDVYHVLCHSLTSTKLDFSENTLQTGQGAWQFSYN